jgi:hypothetical protein
MKISVSVPFAALDMPSLARTQLGAVVRAAFDGRVQIDLHYLNQDFGWCFAATLYWALSLSFDHIYSGTGDWLFRHVAFPDLADNSVEYFRRFYPRPGVEMERLQDELQRKRDAIEGFLQRLILNHMLVGADLVGLTSVFALSVTCCALAVPTPHISPPLTSSARAWSPSWCVASRRAARQARPSQGHFPAAFRPNAPSRLPPSDGGSSYYVG